jgi:hypothetical protein
VRDGACLEGRRKGGSLRIASVDKCIMPAVAARVWNTSRKWLGNLLPALIYLPLALTGVLLIVVRQEFIGPGLWFLVASVVTGWLAMNFLALAGNGFLKRQLRRELDEVHPLKPDAIFIGYARPEFRNLLDPHEDLGYLVLAPERLIFVGEIYRIQMPRTSVTDIRFRPNPHTMVGLGRWIEVQGSVDGKPTSLRFEPRERSTLLGNLFFGSELYQSLNEWRIAKTPSV